MRSRYRRKPFTLTPLDPKTNCFVRGTAAEGFTAFNLSGSEPIHGATEQEAADRYGRRAFGDAFHSAVRRGLFLSRGRHFMRYELRLVDQVSQHV